MKALLEVEVIFFLRVLFCGLCYACLMDERGRKRLDFWAYQKL